MANNRFDLTVAQFSDQRRVSDALKVLRVARPV